MTEPLLTPDTKPTKTTEDTAVSKVENPHGHFDQPMEVVVDPLLSKDEKVRALEALEQDARQLAIASSEGMSGGEETGLHEVLAAKDALELPPVDLAFAAVLQTLKARLPGAEGTPAHAVITNAIAALEAARGVLAPA